MSREVLKQKYYKEAGEEEEEEVIEEKNKQDAPGHFPVSIPKGVRAKDRSLVSQDGFGIESPGTSGSRRVTRGPDADSSEGAAPLVTSHAHHRYFIEEGRPGAFVVAGFGDEERVTRRQRDNDCWVDEEQATVATSQESVVNVIAQVVDMEEENRRLREQDQLHRDHDRLLHEHNRLRDLLDNAVVVTPVETTTHRAEGEDHKFGTRGRQWCAGVIFLVLVTVAIVLALVLPPEPTPEPTTPEPTTPEPTTPELTTPEPTTPEPTTSPKPNSPEPTTQDPVTTIPQDLIDFLSSASSDGGAELAILGTPQNKAYKWLAGNSDLADFTDQDKLQRYALATLYFSTEGDTWNSHDNWLSDEDVCFPLWFGLECTSDGAVKSLDNWGNELIGTLPPEIGMLSQSLESLWFGESLLQSAIPSEIGELTKLIALDLNRCKLTGTIPKEITSLTNLDELQLHGNILTGSYTCPNFIDICLISCDNDEDDNCRSL